jgi:hypothetical protein
LERTTSEHPSSSRGEETAAHERHVAHGRIDFRCYHSHPGAIRQHRFHLHTCRAFTQLEELVGYPGGCHGTVGGSQNRGRTVRIDDALPAQDRRIHHAERGRRDAQSEGEADDRQYEDGRLPSEQAHRISDIAAGVGEQRERRSRSGWTRHLPAVQPQARHIVRQAPVRVKGTALASTCLKEFKQIGLHFGARVVRNTRQV